MVAMKDVNDADIGAMVAFCIEHGFVLRLIEAMPMGDTGRAANYLDLQPVLRQLQTEFKLVEQAATLGGGPARYWKTQDGGFSLGLITPFPNTSAPPATGCGYRWTAPCTCVWAGRKFRTAPAAARRHFRRRAGSGDPRGDRTETGRHEFSEKPQKLVRFMSMTGG